MGLPFKLPVLVVNSALQNSFLTKAPIPISLASKHSHSRPPLFDHILWQAANTDPPSKLPVFEANLTSLNSLLTEARTPTSKASSSLTCEWSVPNTA